MLRRTLYFLCACIVSCYCSLFLSLSLSLARSLARSACVCVIDLPDDVFDCVDCLVTGDEVDDACADDRSRKGREHRGCFA